MTRQVTNILPVIEVPVADGNWDTARVYPINKIIIHTIVGTVQSAINRFNAPRSFVSIHYLIGLDGKLYHEVDEDNVAYQGGNYKINQSSIGIEHEDNGDYNGQRTDQLYQTSGMLVADLCRFWNIPCDRDHIKKHSEVSDHPTACPDALDIDRIIREALGVLNPTPSTPVPPTPVQPIIPAQTPISQPTTPTLEPPAPSNPVVQENSNPQVIVLTPSLKPSLITRILNWLMQ